MLFGVLLFWRLVVGLEKVYAVNRTADRHLEINWMELYFLDLGLALVQKHQLVWNVGIFLLVFY